MVVDGPSPSGLNTDIENMYSVYGSKFFYDESLFEWTRIRLNNIRKFKIKMDFQNENGKRIKGSVFPLCEFSIEFSFEFGANICSLFSYPQIRVP